MNRRFTIKAFFAGVAVVTMLSSGYAQDKMTAELLWKLNRVTPIGISSDQQGVIFSSTQYNAEANTKSTRYFKVALLGGTAIAIDNYQNEVVDKTISPNKAYKIVTKEVKVKSVSGADFYPTLAKSNVQIYDNLNYRHWDTWEDGSYSHLFVQPLGKAPEAAWDIMQDEPFDSPQKPFGGEEDYTWSPDGSTVLYVSKKQFGTAYAISTNTDIYAYDVKSKTTTNLTETNHGYDTQPAYSKDGMLAWLQMKEAGYESDKNDIVVTIQNKVINLTKDWDGTVSSFIWSADGNTIYFNAPTNGTIQLFEVSLPKKSEAKPVVKQVTDGPFDIASLVGQVKNTFVVSRTDMNHAAELFTVDLKKGSFQQLTHANDNAYAKLKLSEVTKRMVTTTDGKQMVTWVIYPPDFDPTKKYPTLLYCQGGPQGALSQFYSYRWNFQLMAANGYIVVAPNRRGMPGYGVEWNKQISGDWGGQSMQDYLSAIDDVSKENYVDKNRLGCVGASYGGYSVFYLAGIHSNRFKTFIAHDGVFNTRSMYGTTEEIFFTNKEFNGPYWDKATAKSYQTYNPIEKVNLWNAPILIIQGGKDYRVPIGQGLEAFQAAQLRGIKSKLVYFPDENHWVLSVQNALVWQHEFFAWLSETL